MLGGLNADGVVTPYDSDGIIQDLGGAGNSIGCAFDTGSGPMEWFFTSPSTGYI